MEELKWLANRQYSFRMVEVIKEFVSSSHSALESPRGKLTIPINSIRSPSIVSVMGCRGASTEETTEADGKDVATEADEGRPEGTAMVGVADGATDDAVIVEDGAIEGESVAVTTTATRDTIKADKFIF